MGKKKKQEKEKKKLSSEEKKLLKARKKAEKTAENKNESKAENLKKKKKADKELQIEKNTEILSIQNLETPSEIPEDIKPGNEAVISVEEATLIFKALGDETRMEILAILQEEELCAMELLQRVKVVQSTLSHHMKVLTDAGLVCCRKDNKRIYYTIHAGRMIEAAVFLQQYQN